MLRQETQIIKANFLANNMEKIFTEEEDDTIRLLADEKCTLEVISKRINCSIFQLRSRANFLGISLDYIDEPFYIDNSSRRSGNFSKEQADLILKGCILGWTWQKIADELGWKRTTTVEVGRRLNARKIAKETLGYDPLNPPPKEEEKNEIEDRERLKDKQVEALPPGHPITWNIISNGMANPFNEKIYHKFTPQQNKIKKDSTLVFNKLHLCFE